MRANTSNRWALCLALTTFGCGTTVIGSSVVGDVPPSDAATSGVAVSADVPAASEVAVSADVAVAPDVIATTDVPVTRDVTVGDGPERSKTSASS